jgi:phenylpropionate dioxygenase-like ring-hydroxylating dioxygenase large terminal subunit
VTGELAWVVVALSPDVPNGVAIPAQIGDQDIALWRSSAGVLRAWADRCPHRGMRLSHGFVRGETLACIYHGWRYGLDGGCIHIPAHPSLDPPKTITARAFACQEGGGVIWVSADPDAPLLAGPENLLPLRSVEIAAPADHVAAHLTPGDQGLSWAGDLAVFLQPLVGGHCRAHVLVRPGTDAKAAARAVETLRRTCEVAPC